MAQVQVYEITAISNILRRKWLTWFIKQKGLLVWQIYLQNCFTSDGSQKICTYWSIGLTPVIKEREFSILYSPDKWEQLLFISRSSELKTGYSRSCDSFLNSKIGMSRRAYWLNYACKTPSWLKKLTFQFRRKSSTSWVWVLLSMIFY